MENINQATRYKVSPEKINALISDFDVYVTDQFHDIQKQVR